jgi:transposase-like protein
VARATYDDAAKARAYVVLQANDGLLKRTARETGIPESTLRSWRDDWDKNGAPQTEVLEVAAKEFMAEGKEIRGMALDVIRQKLVLLAQNPKEAKIAELTTLVGVLTDKIDRATGLDSSSRVDHHHHLPSREELHDLMGGFIDGAIEAATRRAGDVIDAEIVEQAALPPGV